MYNKIALLSPYVEVQLRKFYWKNVAYFKNLKPKRIIASKTDVNWDKIIDYLKQNGISDGTLMILHSSYKSLKSSNLSPKEIIASLRSLLGNQGTLAMPVIRRYDGEPKLEKILKWDPTNIICTYDTKESEIWTGALPRFLTKEKDVVISRHPLNSMAAIGRLANPMMEKNITFDNSTPHGKNSSWAFCFENDAVIVGIGIDLSHSLTIRLVSEDLFMDEWPIKNWYRKRVFNIIDGDYKARINVLEREPKWGCFYLAEVNYRNDLIKNNILISKKISGLSIEIVSAKKLIDFVRSEKHLGYPYYIPKKYFKNERV